MRYYHATKDKILHFCRSFRRTPWSFFTSVTCRTSCNHQMFFQVLSKLVFIPTLFFIVVFFFYMSLVFHPDFSGPYESSPALSSTPTMTTFCCLLFFGFFIDYRECYGFERAFFTLGRFLHYTLNQHLVHEPPQPVFTRFYQSVPGSRKFSFKKQGLSLRFGL